MGVPQLQGVAGGTIRVCRFLKVSDSHTFAEADANEWVAGIASEGSADNPATGTAGNAAESGDQFQFYGDGEICLLAINDTVDCSAASLLKSDADGLGVNIATTGTTVQNYGAEALEDGVAGDRIRVRIIRGKTRPALS